MKKFVSVLLLFVLATASYSQTKELVKVTDMLKIRSIGGINLSNDGSRAVFTVTTIEPDGDSKWENKYVNQVWMVNTDGVSLPKQLTAKEGSSQAAWNPDGKRIAFVRVADGKPQIFLLSLDGGEAIQLTKFRYGAGTPTWSPDGKQLIFSSNISLKDLIKDSLLNPSHSVPSWPYEKPGFNKNDHMKSPAAKADPDGNMEEIRTYLENNANDNKVRVVDKLNFQDETGVSTDMSFNHFFLINVDDATNPIELTKGFYRFSSADFTPDGKQIVLSGDVDSIQHPDRSLESEIFIVNADGSNLRKILGDKDINYNSPQISPSGKWLAFQYGKTSFVTVPTLAIIPINGSPKDKIDIPFDRNKANVVWSRDEKYIYFSAQSNGGQPLYRADVTTKKVEQLSDYNSGITSFDLINDKMVCVKTEVADPFDIYISDANAKNSKRVSDFNFSWVQTKQLSLPEKKTFANNKGMTIEYWIMKPANYEAGKKYPLLLEIHGGPAAMWGPGETTMWHEYQFFCSRGYGVVYSIPVVVVGTASIF